MMSPTNTDIKSNERAEHGGAFGKLLHPPTHRLGPVRTTNGVIGMRRRNRGDAAAAIAPGEQERPSPWWLFVFVSGTTQRLTVRY